MILKWKKSDIIIKINIIYTCLSSCFFKKITNILLEKDLIQFFPIFIDFFYIQFWRLYFFNLLSRILITFIINLYNLHLWIGSWMLLSLFFSEYSISPPVQSRIHCTIMIIILSIIIVVEDIHSSILIQSYSILLILW